jgi:hypothetical protein
MTPETPEDDALGRELRDSRQLHDAPEAVILRAIDVFAARVAAAVPAAEAAPGLLRRLVATLSFDSANLTPLAAGLRSDAAQTRQLLFSAEGRDVDLRVAPTDDGRHFIVSGQVLGPDEAGLAVLHCAEGEFTATWNELSEFQFGPVGPGPCRLALRAEGWEIHLPPLQLGKGG